MAYRSPTLFVLKREELCGWLDTLIASVEVALDQVNAAAATEENATTKAEVWPKWQSDLTARLDQARCLREHVAPEASWPLASEELLSIRRNMQPVEVDIPKIRLSPLEEPDERARQGYIAMPSQSRTDLIRAAKSGKWLGKRQ